MNGGNITGQHEAVLQGRQEVRVRLRVRQLLPEQLKHLAGALGFHVNLHGRR